MFGRLMAGGVRQLKVESGWLSEQQAFVVQRSPRLIYPLWNLASFFFSYELHAWHVRSACLQDVPEEHKDKEEKRGDDDRDGSRGISKTCFDMLIALGFAMFCNSWRVKFYMSAMNEISRMNILPVMFHPPFRMSKPSVGFHLIFCRSSPWPGPRPWSRPLGAPDWLQESFGFNRISICT